MPRNRLLPAACETPLAKESVRRSSSLGHFRLSARRSRRLSGMSDEAALDDLEDLGGATASDGTRVARDLPPVVRVRARRPRVLGDDDASSAAAASTAASAADPDVGVAPSPTNAFARARRTPTRRTPPRTSLLRRVLARASRDPSRVPNPPTPDRPSPVAPRCTSRPSDVPTITATRSSWPVSSRRTATISWMPPRTRTCGW